MTAKLYKIPLFVAKILMILVTRNSDAFPTGAPAYNCRTMKPSHTNYPVPITNKFPFTISASSNSILPGEVAVISVTGEEFQGFLAVSSKVEGSISEIVAGMVPIEQGSSTKTLNCLVANNQQVAMSGVTHTRRLGANKVTFQWMAPTTAVPGSTYQIRVVVVQSFGLYWEPYVVNIVIRSPNEPAASKITTISQIPASTGLTTGEGLTAQSSVQVSTTSSSAPQPSTTSSSAPQPSTTSSSAPQPSTTSSSAPQPSTTSSSAPQPSTTSSSAPQPSTTSSSAPQPSTTSSSAPQPGTAAPSSSAQPNRSVTASSSPRLAVGDGEDRMQTPFLASPTVPSGSRSSSLNSSSPTTASLNLQVRRGNRQDLSNNRRTGRLAGWLNSLFG